MSNGNIRHESHPNTAWLLVCLLTVSFLGLTGHLFSSVIQTDEAKRVAVNWMTLVTNGRGARRPGPIHSQMYQGRVVFYAVDLSPDGWVIVSGDDACWPVIAYSEAGRPDWSALPPAMRGWLEARAAEVGSIVASHAAAEFKTSQAWEYLQNDVVTFENLQPQNRAKVGGVGPLLATQWDQGSFYNEKCPADPDGADGHAVAGCVAVAMAQIMKYWSYPIIGKGELGYTDDTYGWQYANFGASAYDWQSMPVPRATGPNPALATLIYHCGVSVYTDYGPRASSAYLWNAFLAFPKYFRYDNEIVQLAKSEYDDSSWGELIRQEIDQRRPILYRGQSPSSNSGHAFVLDGYQDTNFFHFNWGWSGCCDGYFYLDRLNPASRDYSSVQVGIFHIMPLFRTPHSVPRRCVPGADSGGAGPLELTLESWVPGLLSRWP